MSSPATDAVTRNNVQVVGNSSGRVMVFAHGFGCSQDIWRDVYPAFVDDFSVVLFDHVGAGGSDLASYDRSKYNSLHGYVDDIFGILTQLDLHDVIFVGHSVGSMMGVLAANREPDRFSHLVLVGPSPRYVDQGSYVGGFDQAAIDSLLDTLDSNYLGWSGQMAPVIMGNPDRPELGERLTQSFCSVDPEIARQFARVTFLSDNRRDLPQVSVPTLVIQNTDDVIAPAEVGAFVHAQIPGSTLVALKSTGHIPSLAGPHELVDAIRTFVS